MLYVSPARLPAAEVLALSLGQRVRSAAQPNTPTGTESHLCFCTLCVCLNSHLLPQESILHKIC